MNSKKQLDIFIVDDNNLFIMALKADLENSFVDKNINVHSFETGENCMNMFKEVKPQVVILDYFLNSVKPSAIDGIKVLDWIKKENPETNVIMLTSNDNLDIAVKAFHHGASDYIVKSDTKFQKINYSLLNILKIIKVNRDAIRYKYLFLMTFISIALLIGGAIAVQIFAPSLMLK